ncbi:hypothetical protein SAMN05421539_10187 [Jannaschia seohaensis]|uniref:Uncharacterized protein n=1 Tax=Jannaschia seohaensis TaxID=475081 RepID=A0A2Y9A5V7_9RHOB|nr:hypothetical protein BCF38_10187 [Jannaschia seohaensis]SSA37959.1 hypothetical protein SAMN05421539_10187 [Jannaschia seohaensis]
MTIFEKIITGEVPSAKGFKDNSVYALMDAEARFLSPDA